MRLLGLLAGLLLLAGCDEATAVAYVYPDTTIVADTVWVVDTVVVVDTVWCKHRGKHDGRHCD
jgi:uncharacterized lipoprotein YajG